jgi:hypothetical protein
MLLCSGMEPRGFGFTAGSTHASDLFYLPSPASVLSVNLQTTGTVLSVFQAPINPGVNNITLGVSAGLVMDLTFSVSDGSTTGAQHTFRLIQTAVSVTSVIEFVHPPSQHYIGSSVPLELDVQCTSCTTDADFQALTYVWKSKTGDGDTASTILNPSNPSLTSYIFDDSALMADTTIVVSVRATDTNSSHADPNTGAQPTTLISTSVRILAPIVETVSVSDPAADACAGSTLCKHGGTCMAALAGADDNGTMSYSLSCSCPPQFYGLVNKNRHCGKLDGRVH